VPAKPLDPVAVICHRPEPARPPRSEVRRQQKAERERIGRLNGLDSLLRETFPESFGAIVPLATGIRTTIVELVAGEYSKDEVDRLLRYRTRSEQYLRALALGERRRNLDGTADKAPTLAQSKLAAKQLKLKAAARSIRKGMTAAPP
jgi:sRNA-binding protein